MSTPRRRIFKHTPANGSPVLSLTSRMSPTLAASGLALENNLERAPVGSSTEICALERVDMGSLQAANAEGGGA